MRILFDHQIYSFQDYGGISRYFYELAKGINKTNNKVLVEGKFTNNVYLKNLKNNVIGFIPGFSFPYKNVIIFYLNNLFGEKMIKNCDFDLLHATYYHPYFLKKLKNKPYVITVPDMIHEIYNKDYKDLNNKTSVYKKETVLNAKQIIVISRNTKKDLIKFYKIAGKKINVIYLGNPLDGVFPSKIGNLPKKYILFVGNRLGYKNFQFFVKSIANILKSNDDIYLLCAGGGGFTDYEKNIFKKLDIENKVLHKKFKSDRELAYIYKKALIYVIPSLYEGFGLTVLEAFSMGCPVIASKTSSIPEVAGNAAYYNNPKDADSIRNSVEKLLNNQRLRLVLIEKGKTQLQKFSWDKTVQETVKVYKSVLNLKQ